MRSNAVRTLYMFLKMSTYIVKVSVEKIFASHPAKSGIRLTDDVAYFNFNRFCDVPINVDLIHAPVTGNAHFGPVCVWDKLQTNNKQKNLK